MHDLGDTVPLAVDVLDEDGAGTTAGSVVLTVDLPDGTMITPTVTPVATVGRYECDFVPTQAGRHVVRWVSTAPATAYTDVIDVRPTARRHLFALATFKAHLNRTSHADDEELRGYIEAATLAVERHLGGGQAVCRLAVTGEVHRLGRGRTVLSLDRWPLQRLTAVTSHDGATVHDLDDFILDRAAGIVGGLRLTGDVAVSYVAGPVDIDPAVSLAGQIIAAHLLELQRTAGIGQQTGFGGEDIMTSAGQGYAIPHRAVE
ncbi:MAG: hypothetical protein ACRCZP_12945, partial [Phycicoccus sp.]